MFGIKVFLITLALAYSYPDGTYDPRKDPYPSFEYNEQDISNRNKNSKEDNVDFLPNGCPLDSYVHWLMPHESDCQMYYTCNFGAKVPMICGEGTHFNYILQICEWPANAGCAIKYDENNDKYSIASIDNGQNKIDNDNTLDSNTKLHQNNDRGNIDNNNLEEELNIDDNNEINEIEHKNREVKKDFVDSAVNSKGKTNTVNVLSSRVDEISKDENVGQSNKKDIIFKNYGNIDRSVISNYGNNDRNDNSNESGKDMIDTEIGRKEDNVYNKGGVKTNYGDNVGKGHSNISGKLDKNIEIGRKEDNVNNKGGVKTNYGNNYVNDNSNKSGKEEKNTEIDKIDENVNNNGARKPPNGCPTDFSIRQLLPHENYCTKYYYCHFGELVEVECGDGLYFNFELQGCDSSPTTCSGIRSGDHIAITTVTEDIDNIIDYDDKIQTIAF